MRARRVRQAAPALVPQDKLVNLEVSAAWQEPFSCKQPSLSRQMTYLKFRPSSLSMAKAASATMDGWRECCSRPSLPIRRRIASVEM